jgi:hypothetical protein
MPIHICESRRNPIGTGAETGVGQPNKDINDAAKLAQDDALAKVKKVALEALEASKANESCQADCVGYYYYQVDFMPAVTVHGAGGYVATMPLYWNLYLDCLKSHPTTPPRPEPLTPIDPAIPTGPSARAIYLIGANWGKIEYGPEGPTLKLPKNKGEELPKKKSKKKSKKS